MRIGGRRTISLVAIYAIALHAILWTAAAQPAGAPFDPLAVICHSNAGAPGEQAPADAPAKACDHCTLCSAAAPPPTPGTAPIVRLAPAKFLQILPPASPFAYDGTADNPNRTRGPPQFA
jgi:hypothetical protein